jgi:hypothetical protein
MVVHGTATVREHIRVLLHYIKRPRHDIFVRPQVQARGSDQMDVILYFDDPTRGIPVVMDKARFANVGCSKNAHLPTHVRYDGLFEDICSSKLSSSHLGFQPVSGITSPAYDLTEHRCFVVHPISYRVFTKRAIAVHRCSSCVCVCSWWRCAPLHTVGVAVVLLIQSPFPEHSTRQRCQRAKLLAEKTRAERRTTRVHLVIHLDVQAPTSERRINFDTLFFDCRLFDC